MRWVEGTWGEFYVSSMPNMSHVICDSLLMGAGGTIDYIVNKNCTISKTGGLK